MYNKNKESKTKKTTLGHYSVIQDYLQAIIDHQSAKPRHLLSPS